MVAAVLLAFSPIFIPFGLMAVASSLCLFNALPSDQLANYATPAILAYTAPYFAQLVIGLGAWVLPIAFWKRRKLPTVT